MVIACHKAKIIKISEIEKNYEQKKQETISRKRGGFMGFDRIR
jgi:hypothetical protein